VLLQLITLRLLDDRVMLLLHQLAGKGTAHQSSSSANSIVSDVIYRENATDFETDEADLAALPPPEGEVIRTSLLALLNAGFGETVCCKGPLLLPLPELADCRRTSSCCCCCCC